MLKEGELEAPVDVDGASCVERRVVFMFEKLMGMIFSRGPYRRPVDMGGNQPVEYLCVLNGSTNKIALTSGSTLISRLTSWLTAPFGYCRRSPGPVRTAT